VDCDVLRVCANCAQVGELRRETIKTLKGLESDDSPSARNPLQVAEKLKEQIEAFRAKMPLIACICNKGMRDRHWVQVSDILGYPFQVCVVYLLNYRPTDLLNY
jgi:hypothetical protein